MRENNNTGSSLSLHNSLTCSLWGAAFHKRRKRCFGTSLRPLKQLTTPREAVAAVPVTLAELCSSWSRRLWGKN
jgi:hypothetical protein